MELIQPLTPTPRRSPLFGSTSAVMRTRDGDVGGKQEPEHTGGKVSLLDPAVLFGLETPGL